MGGYNPDIPVDPDAPAKTREAADQRNVVGNRNRAAVGLPYWEQTSSGQQQEVPQQRQQQQQPDRPGFPAGYVGGVLNPDGSITGGHPAEADMERDRQRAGMYTNNEAQFRLMSNIEKYRVESRPDYVPLTQLGNSETQRLFRETSNTLSSEQQFASMGRILESQRDAAYKTRGLEDDRYFDSALEQWGQNASEESAAQHHLLKASDISGSNYLETRGDAAIEFLKGNPGKSSERFSPLSGQLAGYLPGGRGFQQYTWDKAIAASRGLPAPGEVSFMSAVERVGSARGTLFDPYFERSANRTSMVSPVSAFGSEETPSWLPGGVSLTGAFGKVASGKAQGQDWNPFIASAASPTGYISEGKQLGWTGQNARPTSYTEDVRNWFRDAPVLGFFYKGGSVFAAAHPDEVSRLRQNTQTAPVFESVYKGGEVFGLKGDYEKDPTVTTEDRYNKAASALVGNVDQTKLVTYGVGNALGEWGTGYNSVMSPVTGTLKRYGWAGEFGAGVVSTPSTIASMGQSTLIGGETLIRNARNAPGITTAGVAMQIKGTWDQVTTNPAEFAGTVVGVALLTGGVRGVSGRAMGMARTRGMGYVPIENIGYDARSGFAIGNPTEASLTRSFQQGTLSPRPTRMSATRTGIDTTFPFIHRGLPVEVPYVPGVGGRPLARLPNAAPGDITLWTAHESSTLSRGVGVGEAYRLATTGSSEVQGVYGASTLMSYFAKVGGQIPKMIGFDLPFKTPVGYSTTVADIEAVSRSTTRAALGKNYGPMNEYIQRTAAQRPGTAFMPLAKSEYEAVIPTNAVIEVTGRNYYTKLGGIGESHFGGTRVPIVEQNVIGFRPGPVEPGIVSRSSSGSLSRKPVISGFNIYVGSSITHQTPSGPMFDDNRGARGISSGGNNKIRPITIGAYSPPGISVLSPGVPSRKGPYLESNSKPSIVSSRGSTEAASSGRYSQVYSPISSVTLPSYKTSILSSKPSTPFLTTSSPKITTPGISTTSRSGITTPYTPRYTPPYSPRYTPVSTPVSSPTSSPVTPPVPPITPIPPFGGSMGGGGGGSPFGMRAAAPWSRRNLTGAELFKGKKNKKGGFRPPF